MPSNKKVGALKLHKEQNFASVKGVQGLYVGFKKSCTDDYRYGFNGKEKDNEVKGTGNSLDFGARIYDSRLGRWLSLDPLQAKYPDLSPYNFCANNPTLFVDPDGKRIFIYYNTGELDKKGNAIIKKAEYKNGALVDKKGNIISMPAGNEFASTVVATLNLISTTKTGKNVVDNVVNSKKKVEITEQSARMGTLPDGSAIDAGGLLNSNVVGDNALQADMLANEIFAVYQAFNGEGGNDINKEVASYLFSNAVAEMIDPTYMNRPQGDPKTAEGQKFNKDYDEMINSKSFDQAKYSQLVTDFTKTEVGKAYTAERKLSNGKTFTPPVNADKKDPVIKECFPLK
jgi:RHS repeat-associated protein